MSAPPLDGVLETKVNWHNRSLTDVFWAVLYFANVLVFLGVGITFATGSRGPTYVLNEDNFLARNPIYDKDFETCCATLQASGQDLGGYGNCYNAENGFRHLSSSSGKTHLSPDSGIFDAFGAAPGIPVMLIIAVVVIAVAWVALLRVAAKAIVLVTELTKIGICVYLGVSTSNVTFYVIAGLYLVVILWKRKQLLFATKIIEHAALGLQSNGHMFVAILIILLALVAVVFLFIFFVSKYVDFVEVGPLVNTQCDTFNDDAGSSMYGSCLHTVQTSDCDFVSSTHKGDLLWVLVFSYIWNCFWFNQVRLYVITLIVASWHWHPADKPTALQALSIVATKGVGTVSIASLLLAIVEQIKRQTKFRWWHILSPAHLLLDVLGWMLITCLNMLTKYTLIIHVLSGKSFLQSGKSGFHLMKRHFQNGVITEMTSKNVMTLSSLVFSFAIYVIGWVWLDDQFGTESFTVITHEKGLFLLFIILEGILIWYPSVALVIFILIDPLIKGSSMNVTIVVAAMLIGVVASLLFNFMSGVILDTVDVCFVLFAVDKDNGVDLSNSSFAQDIVKHIPTAIVSLTLDAKVGGGLTLAVLAPPPQQQYAVAAVAVAGGDKAPQQVYMGVPGTIVIDPNTGQQMMMVAASPNTNTNPEGKMQIL